MKKLIELIDEFEKRNNLSITVELFSDGCATVKEFWDEDIFKECTDLETLCEFLGTANLKKSKDGRVVNPIVIL